VLRSCSTCLCNPRAPSIIIFQHAFSTCLSTILHLNGALIDRSSTFGRTRAKSQHISDSLLMAPFFARHGAQSEFIRTFDNPQSHVLTTFPSKPTIELRGAVLCQSTSIEPSPARCLLDVFAISPMKTNDTVTMTGLFLFASTETGRFHIFGHTDRPLGRFSIMPSYQLENPESTLEAPSFPHPIRAETARPSTAAHTHRPAHLTSAFIVRSSFKSRS